MRRALIALFLAAVAGIAANVKLYLKDGTFQIVREYQVQTDRVRFYSVERSQWEEIPLGLVDLQRTKAEVTEREAVRAEGAKVLSEEEHAERALKEEISKIPQDPGVYYVEGDTPKALKVGEVKVHNNKGRNVLRVLTPVPVVNGKSTLEMDGEHSPNIIANPEQEYYIRLSEEERFGIIKLTPGHGVRVVEKITFVPVTKENFEEPVEVEIFRKQMEEGLYKLWPQKPLPPGEYAVMEYTPGKVNMQVWDFAIRSGK